MRTFDGYSYFIRKWLAKRHNFSVVGLPPPPPPKYFPSFFPRISFLNKIPQIIHLKTSESQRLTSILKFVIAPFGKNSNRFFLKRRQFLSTLLIYYSFSPNLSFGANYLPICLIFIKSFDFSVSCADECTVLSRS